MKGGWCAHTSIAGSGGVPIGREQRGWRGEGEREGKGNVGGLGGIMITDTKGITYRGTLSLYMIYLW